MKVLITGSTGLIGSALVPLLTTGGHRVLRLVRSAALADSESVHWDPSEGKIDMAGLEGMDVVIHLAGENISGRWTTEKKRRIRESRIKGTRLLAESLARLSMPPKALVCASAVGYYGDRGDEVLREASPAGRGFLAEVCQEWEAASEPAAQKGIRVVRLRIGVILSAAGGALTAMLPPFKMGVGGVIGSGRQYMSWIGIDDVVGVFHHAMTNESLRGTVNTVAPGVVTNGEFTKTLGRVLGRPTIFPMPAFAARLAFGEMADELLLSSTRVDPGRLKESHYQFRNPDLEGALRRILGRAS